MVHREFNNSRLRYLLSLLQLVNTSLGILFIISINIKYHSESEPQTIKLCGLVIAEALLALLACILGLALLARKLKTRKLRFDLIDMHLCLALLPSTCVVETKGLIDDINLCYSMYGKI